jgi:hypothetical protein
LALWLQWLAGCTVTKRTAAVVVGEPPATALAKPDAVAVILTSYRRRGFLNRCSTTVDLARERFIEDCMDRRIKAAVPSVKLVRMAALRSALRKPDTAGILSGRDELLNRLMQDQAAVPVRLRLRYLVFVNAMETRDGFTQEHHGAGMIFPPVGLQSAVRQAHVTGKLDAAVVDLANGSEVATLSSSSTGVEKETAAWVVIVPVGRSELADVQGPACDGLGAAVGRLWVDM